MRVFVCTETAKTSKYKGVYWDVQNQKWRAGIMVNNKQNHGGYYISELDAAYAVNGLCDDLGLERKNPELGDSPSNLKVRSLSMYDF